MGDGELHPSTTGGVPDRELRHQSDERTPSPVNLGRHLQPEPWGPTSSSASPRSSISVINTRRHHQPHDDDKPSSLFRETGGGNRPPLPPRPASSHSAAQLRRPFTFSGAYPQPLTGTLVLARRARTGEISINTNRRPRPSSSRGRFAREPSCSPTVAGKMRRRTPGAGGQFIHTPQTGFVLNAQSHPSPAAPTGVTLKQFSRQLPGKQHTNLQDSIGTITSRTPGLPGIARVRSPSNLAAGRARFRVGFHQQPAGPAATTINSGLLASEPRHCPRRQRKGSASGGVVNSNGGGLSVAQPNPGTVADAHPPIGSNGGTAWRTTVGKRPARTLPFSRCDHRGPREGSPRSPPLRYDRVRPERHADVVHHASAGANQRASTAASTLVARPFARGRGLVQRQPPRPAPDGSGANGNTTQEEHHHRPPRGPPSDSPPGHPRPSSPPTPRSPHSSAQGPACPSAPRPASSILANMLGQNIEPQQTATPASTATSTVFVGPVQERQSNVSGIDPPPPC